MKLSLWKSRQLSFGGRITLINSVLSSLPLYYFSFYKAPKRVISEIVKLQRNFLWCGHADQRKIAWISWEKICLPKDRGGLGVKNLEAFNIALLSKWRWWCLEGRDTVWHEILSARYGDLRRWYEGAVPQSRLRKASIWWRDITHLGNDYTENANWFKRVTSLKIGRGDLAKFWKDTWCGPTPFSVLFSDLYEICEEKNAKIEQFGMWRDDRWVWCWDWAAGCEDEAGSSLHELKTILLDVQLDISRSDSWTWSIGVDKYFTVKSCYSWLIDCLAGTPDNDACIVNSACKKLWRCDAPTKALFLAWRVLLGRLPTRDELLKRGVANVALSTCCACCFHAEETIQHLFFECSKVLQVWSKIFSWLNIQPVTEQGAVNNFNAFGLSCKGLKLRRLKYIVWVATLWAVWFIRNKIMFEEAIFNVHTVVNHVKLISWGWFISRRGRRTNWKYDDWLICPIGCMLNV